MKPEQTPIFYYCITCDAGPWTKEAKGSNSKTIVSFHTELGHDVQVYDEQKYLSLKDGAKADHRYNTPEREPRDYEIALFDAEVLENYMENGIGNNSEEYALHEITRLLITSKHIISIIDLERELTRYCKKFSITDVNVSDIVDIVYHESYMFDNILNICFQIGKRKKNVMFSQSQFTEAAYWLMGRYSIKRIELTGDLIFFNDYFYERNAEALIRRKGRKLITRSKSSDMTEIFRRIEDSCDIIRWNDIESATHLKCLLNGVYDIKRGVFSTKFSPDNLILAQIPHNFDENASFDRIDEKVKEIIDNSIDRQSYYDHLSTCLHPFTGIDFQFGGVGPAGTGKSEITELSRLVLGNENVNNAPIHLIAKDMTTQKETAFKMLNIDPDLSSESIRQIDTIKKWITQDPFTGRGIYERSTTFRPMSRLCFMANDLYEITNEDDAEAIYERTHLIKIINKFRGTKKQIRKVIQKVSTPKQLDGFITYLLKNAHEIYINQKIHHPIQYSVVEDLWNLHGNRIKEFIQRRIKKGADCSCQKSDPWDAWLKYAHERGFPIKKERQFYEIFDSLVGTAPIKTRRDNEQIYGYVGLRVLTPPEIKEIDKSPLFIHENDVNNGKALKAPPPNLSSTIAKYLKSLKIEQKHDGAFRAFDDNCLNSNEKDDKSDISGGDSS